LNQNCPHYLAVRIAGSGLQRDQSNNALVISYKNVANTTYSTYQLDQVNLMDFIVEPYTN